MTHLSSPTNPTMTLEPSIARTRHEEPAVPPAAHRASRDHSRGGRRPFVVAALVAYLVLACLAFWPVGPLDGTRLPSVNGDPVQMTWFLAWIAFAVSHGHNPFFTTALNAPFGVNLADNPSIPLLGLIGSPVTLALGPIAAMNLMVRLGLAASGGSFYLVTRRRCRSELAPFLGGCCYGLSSPVVSHLAAWHLNLVWLCLLPVLVYCGERLLVDQRGSPSRIGALTGLVAAMQYLVSAELFADLAVLAVVGAVIVAVARRSAPPQRVGYALKGSVTALCVFAVVAGYPIGMALFGPRHISGSIQPAAHLQAFHVDLLGPLVPTHWQSLDPSFVHGLGRDVFHAVVAQGGSSETGAYLGLPLVALLVWFVVRERRDLRVTGFAALSAVAFVLSLGSHLQVAGHPLGWLPLPETIFSHLPVFDNAVPARFFIVAVLFAFMVFSVGLDRALTRLTARRRIPSVDAVSESRGSRRRPVCFAAVVLLALAALVPAFPLTTETAPTPPGLAAAVRRLVPSGSRLAAYPFARSHWDEMMLLQAVDGFRFSLVGGYAYVPRPGGGGQAEPTTIEPAWVEQFLEGAQINRNVGFLLKSAPGDPVRLFARFLRNSGATVFLFYGTGNHANAVRDVADSAVGARWRSDGGLSSWRVHRRA